MLDRPRPAYTLPARILHWITAILVLTTIPIGLVMKNLLDVGPLQDVLFHLHRSIGAVLMPIVALRLTWRLTHPPLPLPADIPLTQRTAALAMHWLLYVALIVQPIVGWIATSAYGAPILVFWLFELPPIWPRDSAFSEEAFAVHRVLGISIAVLVCGHVGAALFHHFIRKDGVLMRMVGG